MKKIADGYFALLKALAVLCLVIMIVLVFANVVLRYIFATGISVSEEFSRWMFVWMTFIGAILGMREQIHLGIDTVVNRLPSAARKAVVVVSHGLQLYVCWLLFIGSWDQTVVNLDVSAPASGLSNAWFYSVGIVFSVSAAAILAWQLFEQLRGQGSHELHRVAPEAAGGISHATKF